MRIISEYKKVKVTLIKSTIESDYIGLVIATEPQKGLVTSLPKVGERMTVGNITTGKFTKVTKNGGSYTCECLKRTYRISICK